MTPMRLSAAPIRAAIPGVRHAGTGTFPLSTGPFATGMGFAKPSEGDITAPTSGGTVAGYGPPDCRTRISGAIGNAAPHTDAGNALTRGASALRE